MKDWQATVLFIVGSGGAVLLLLAPAFGVEVSPIAASPIGVILTWVLSQKARAQGDEKKPEGGDDHQVQAG